MAKTFGFSMDGSNPFAIENIIFASPATMPEAGEAYSISARTQVVTVPHLLKCALYKVSDLSFVAETEEKEVPIQPTPTITEFVFSNRPQLESGVEYYICVWSNATSGTTFLLTKTETGTDSISDNLTYNGFPSNITADTTENDVSGDLFCTYTQTITGSKGTRAITTSYPNVEGITARTTKARSEGRFLTAEQSFIREKDKDGIY